MHHKSISNSMIKFTISKKTVDKYKYKRKTNTHNIVELFFTCSVIPSTWIHLEGSVIPTTWIHLKGQIKMKVSKIPFI